MENANNLLSAGQCGEALAKVQRCCSGEGSAVGLARKLQKTSHKYYQF